MLTRSLAFSSLVVRERQVRGGASGWGREVKTILLRFYLLVFDARRCAGAMGREQVTLARGGNRHHERELTGKIIALLYGVVVRNCGVLLLIYLTIGGNIITMKAENRERAIRRRVSHGSCAPPPVPWSVRPFARSSGAARRSPAAPSPSPHLTSQRATEGSQETDFKKKKEIKEKEIGTTAPPRTLGELRERISFFLQLATRGCRVSGGSPLGCRSPSARAPRRRARRSG